MLEDYIGPDAFQTGLATYFNKYKYTNTVGDDLWEMFSSVSGQDIASFMNTWISQSGYPVLHVSQAGDQLTLSQEQFFTGPHEASDKLWPIPLGSSDPDLPALLNEQSITITRSSDEPLRFNVGDTAHFITHYDKELLADLIHTLRLGELAPLDRLQLLHEQSLLARGGIVQSASLVPLVQAYREETVGAVWSIISLTIGELRKLAETNEKSEAKLRVLAGTLAEQQYARLGWTKKDNEPEDDTKLRATILSLMVYSENAEVIEAARRLYETTSLGDLDPELRPLILSAVVRYGTDTAVIESLLETYTKTHSAGLRKDIAAALSSTKDEALVTRLLGLITDGKTIRSQDSVQWYIWLLRNRNGRSMAWKWLQDNWTWIEKTFDGDKSYGAFAQYSASFLTTRQQLEEYRQFFTPMLTDAALSRVITVGLSEIEGRVDLIERDSEAVQAALLKL
jgi:aminopeptidase N